MVLSLSESALCCLCRMNNFFRVPYDRTPELPLPSVVEEIVTSDSFAFVLPPSIADLLVDRLARRGKLTANFLDVLLDPKRVRLSKLSLNYVTSIHKEKFVLGLQKQTFIESVDVSFSILGLSVPFLQALSASCAKTLTSLSASFVTDDLGWSRLSQFVHLRHLDVSFTSIEHDQLQSALTSLTLLKHLNISGTDLTWHQLCNFPCCDLRSLDMSSLRFLETTERTLVFSPDFTTAWISRFFSNQPNLSELDISHVVTASSEENDSLSATLHAILTCCSSITHLAVTSPDLNAVVHELQTTNTLSRLELLRHFGSLSDETIFSVLNSRERLRYALTSGNSDASHFEFREDFALKEKSVLSTAIEASSQILSDGETSIDLLGLTEMILSAFCRLQIDSSLELELAEFNVSAWLKRLKSLNDDVVYFRSSNELLELALQFGLSRTVTKQFASMVFSFLVNFADISVHEEALLGLALNFVVKRMNESDYGGMRVLSSLLHEMSDDRREHLALEKGLLRLLHSRVLSLPDELERDIQRVPFPEILWRMMYEFPNDVRELEESIRQSNWQEEEEIYYSNRACIMNEFSEDCSDVLAALKSLCTGLPNVLESLAKLPQTAACFAAMASTDVSAFDVEPNDGGFYKLGGAIEILTSIAECSSLRSSVLISDVINALFDVLRIEDDMLLALSHLACLLLLDEDRLSWPSDCPTKDFVLTNLITASLSKIDSALEHPHMVHPQVSQHAVSLLSLKEMVKCKRFPEIAVFALWRLAPVCRNEFGLGSGYKVDGFCLICLVKDDVTLGAIEKLPILSKFPALTRKLVAVAEECRCHKLHD